MVGTMERFEVIGRGVLEMALQPSNSQPSNGASSQPQPSNPPQVSQYASQPPIFSNSQKSYQGPNATQPSAPFIASSNPTQPLYAPPASQAPESYSEPYIDYNGFEFLATKHLRSRVDALLETLCRSPRMRTSLSLHLPLLYQP
jgi:hypothetical protein